MACCVFQGSSQSEVEGWISSIHSSSAVQFVGSRGKEQTRWLLTSKLEKIQENIESDCKLKKMAELQLTVVSDSKNKQVITDQVCCIIHDAMIVHGTFQTSKV